MVHLLLGIKIPTAVYWIVSMPFKGNAKAEKREARTAIEV